MIFTTVQKCKYLALIPTDSCLPIALHFFPIFYGIDVTASSNTAESVEKQGLELVRNLATVFVQS